MSNLCLILADAHLTVWSQRLNLLQFECAANAQRCIYRVRHKKQPLRKLKFLENNKGYFAVFFIS